MNTFKFVIIDNNDHKNEIDLTFTDMDDFYNFINKETETDDWDSKVEELEEKWGNHDFTGEKYSAGFYCVETSDINGLVNDWKSYWMSKNKIK